METRKNYQSDLAIHAGEFLLETIESLGMTQTELAKRMDRPLQAINEIITGKKSITSATAIQLENVTGVPAHIWVGLDAEYNMVMAREAEEKQLSRESRLLPLFPYSDLVKIGLVKASRNITEKVAELKKFFSVADLAQLKAIKVFSPAFRLSGHDKISHEAIATWIQTGIILAGRIKTEKYDEQKLKANISELRKNVIKPDINDAISSIKRILADCGVALIMFPHFQKTHINGATCWLEHNNKAVIMMSLRGKYSDVFWFSFFHELAHILLHDKRELFLENGHNSEELSKQEKEADSFASEILIPSMKFEKFVENGVFTAASIEKFAKKISIKPSVVVGRLMHEGHIEYNNFSLLRLRDKYDFKMK